MAESRTHTPIPIPRQFCLLVPPVSVSWEPFLTPHQQQQQQCAQSKSPFRAIMMADIIIGVNFIHQMRCSQALGLGSQRDGQEVPLASTYSEHRMCRIINSLIHLSSCRSVAARSRRNSSTLTNPARPRRAKANSCTLWCLGWSTHVEWWGWGEHLLAATCLFEHYWNGRMWWIFSDQSIAPQALWTPRMWRYPTVRC